jgi:hypothetical protein
MQYLWILAVIASSSFAGYLSYKSNISQDLKWTVYLWALNILPIWAIIARYSKSLIFDGLLYDTLLIVSYTVAVVAFSNKTISLNAIQTSCVGIIVLALIIFKIAE